jgi:hypothetical protein
MKERKNSHFIILIIAGMSVVFSTALCRMENWKIPNKNFTSKQFRVGGMFYYYNELYVPREECDRIILMRIYHLLSFAQLMKNIGIQIRKAVL